MNVKTEFAAYQERINRFLAHCLSSLPSLLKPLSDAMNYAVLNGGKRLRPLFVYTLGTALEVPLQRLDHAACAIELIHAYSLIHDDLPCMDNDDWRRGRPTCHKQFGEAMALLAGDSLQTLAFDVLLMAPIDSIKRVRMLTALVKAAGPWGMVGGQAMDFSRSSCSDQVSTENIYFLKTGALFVAALQMPAIIADLSDDYLLALKNVANNIGLAYQIQDDVCDNENAYFWEDDIQRESHLQRLKEQILADLDLVLGPSESKNQSVFQLINDLFISRAIENNYQLNREKSFL